MQGFFYDCVCLWTLDLFVVIDLSYFSVWLPLISSLCMWQVIPGILLNFFINSVQKYWELLLQGKCYNFPSLFEPDFSGLEFISAQPTKCNHKKIIAIIFIYNQWATNTYISTNNCIYHFLWDAQKTNSIHDYQINHQLLRYQSNELIQY